VVRLPFDTALFVELLRFEIVSRFVGFQDAAELFPPELIPFVIFVGAGSCWLLEVFPFLPNQ
jgi:hypothetical protein